MYQLISLFYLYDYPLFGVDWGCDFSYKLNDSSNGNPITKQHDFILLPLVESEEVDFCVTLADDSIKSDHCKVVRIDYSHSQQQPTSITTTTPMDIFSSYSR
ncbi:hypothetical protein DVH24_035564 [Malus domestica]|uniref:Uncharacterized protein n=1 Tax=Malus domestica TaxID=3750 RepID=A0A498J5M8_MALDO|nr:hypothetical protein DVH24_035564 [Malus domestica]